MKRLIDGALLGAGFVAVLAVAFLVAWAGDVFTVDKDGTPKFAVSDQGKITVGATESYVNLVIQNDEVAAEADNKVDITADVLTVEGIRLENVNVPANIETSGAGGLDTGSEAANTWYYVWVITNNDGTSRNGLLTAAGSASEFAPVLPSGYTKKRRVGAVRNQGSPGNFLSFVQTGNVCQYLDIEQARILNGGSATGAYVIVPADSFIPPTSRKGKFSIIGGNLHSSSGLNVSTNLKSPASSGIQFRLAMTSIANIMVRGSATADIETDNLRRIEYKMDNAPDGGWGAFIDVCGYYDRI